MATRITEACINCGACEPECPNEAIHPGDPVYVIEPDRCTECVGFHDEEQCQAVCPVACCLPDPERPETEAELLRRATRLHPEAVFGDAFPSRFRRR
jgi:ferredoxin